MLLINSILNQIPFFYLSFMKLPIKVWKRIVGIETPFLWVGSKGAKEIPWVSQVELCGLFFRGSGMWKKILNTCYCKIRVRIEGSMFKNYRVLDGMGFLTWTRWSGQLILVFR